MPSRTTRKKESFLIKAEYRILLGTIGFINANVILILSGKPDYNPDTNIAEWLLIVSSALLGLGIIKYFKRDNEWENT